MPATLEAGGRSSRLCDKDSRPDAIARPQKITSLTKKDTDKL